MVRYLAAGLLAIAGITAAMMWISAVAQDYNHYVNRLLPHASAPGQVTLHANHPGTCYVYAECRSSFDRTAVRVTGPAGRAEPVTATSAGGYP